VFYETEGDGEPIVLLHGGLADNSTWAAQFAGFAPHRRVVAPERQAQGHTPDRPGPLTYQGMADQTVSFLNARVSAPWISWGGVTGAWWVSSWPRIAPSSSGRSP
jgi:pimeloyl-ACP methyl ester carboxylesterase